MRPSDERSSSAAQGGSCQDAPRTLAGKFRELDADPRQGIQGEDGDLNLGSLRRGAHARAFTHTAKELLHAEGADTSP
jgi:hypothetical protein